MTEKIGAAEGAAALVGAVLLGTIMTLLAYDALAGDHSPPDIVVEPASIAPVSGGFVVRFTAFNRGGETAQGVEVEGRVRSGEHRDEAPRTTLGYIPARSLRSGGLFFSFDPRCCGLELRAAGYQQP